MSAPEPSTVDEVAAHLHRLTDGERSVQHRYRDLYPSGYEVRRGGHPGSGGDDLNDLARLLGITGPARVKLEQAAKHMARAEDEANAADKCLTELVRLIDAGADRTIVPMDVRRLLRDVQRDEQARNCADGKAAKARRVARGEVWPGDGGLPRAAVS